jgi:PadR family transcriptional regulator, regulatory protein PadR
MSTADLGLPRKFLRPCILLLLREEPAHGYDLLERLRPLGFTRDDPGRLYRALRALEEEKLLRSAWEPSGTGPDRRIYELTKAGVEELHLASKSLAETREQLGFYLSRYEEFVASTPTPRASRAATQR